LVYVSRWSGPEKASAFAAIYAQSLVKRYKQVHEVSQDQKNPPEDLQKVQSLLGSHTWLTEEGPVVIAMEGDSVLITESLDQLTTEHLERELFEPVPASAR
jgi:cytochrome c